MAQNTDNSNTQDVFVPDLPRHKFNVMAASGQGDMPAQPGFNIADKAACDYVWTGYIKIAADLQAPTIQVGADDWATFKLDAFDTVAEVDRPTSQVGPAGGGQFYTGSAKTLPDLGKGYYRVRVTYQNVNYTAGKNAARLEVKLNGAQINLGELKAYNLLENESADTFLSKYAAYGYIALPNAVDENGQTGSDKVFAAIGGPINDAHIAGTYVNSCATRLSIGLSQFGVNLSGAPGANNIGSGNKDVLGGFKHIILSADRMGDLLKQKLGTPDFSTLSKYQDACKHKVGTEDIIIFHVPYGAYYSDAGHVGMGAAQNGFRDGDFHNDFDTVNIWILKRPTWESPATPKLP